VTNGRGALEMISLLCMENANAQFIDPKSALISFCKKYCDPFSNLASIDILLIFCCKLMAGFDFFRVG
jgi:hypothetical protein